MKAPHKALDIVRLGLASLAVHKVRSALTALGIIVGVTGVVAMLAISEGLAYESQLALRELGSDNIIIDSVKPVQDQSKASGSRSMVTAYGLTRSNVKSVLSNVPGIRRSAEVHRQRKNARVDNRIISTAVMGTQPAYQDLARLNLLAGRFINEMDIHAQAPHAVITQGLARRLFVFRDPLGKIIRLGGEPFTVVGVMEKIPSTLADQAGDTQNCAIIPLTTTRSRFGQMTIEMQTGSFSAEQVYASQLVLQMVDEQALLDGAAVVRNLMERDHSEKQDYQVRVPLELLEQRQKQHRLWNIVFLAIALISLVVGGIGIMNIMLATVTERTREIGIRRALGAKRRDIITQFLVESVTLSTVGGLLGLAMGLAVPSIVERMLNFTTIITPGTLLLPFIVAVMVGLLSGLYPAMRAAALDPIEALRHE